jgi:hypothetical protein
MSAPLKTNGTEVYGRRDNGIALTFPMHAFGLNVLYILWQEPQDKQPV